jgi:biotin carboxylase
VTGVDLAGLAVAFALGEPVEVPSHGPTAGGGCVRFLVAPVGELREVLGVDESLALEGVSWVRVYRRPGHMFGPLRRGADRAGAVLALGASRAEALAHAERAARLVRFDVVS